MIAARALTQRPDRVFLGIVLVLCSTLLTSSQDAFIKAASSGLTLWQLYVLRSLFIIPAFLLIALRWGEGRASLGQALSRWPLARSLCFLGMYFGLYGAIPYLTLSAIAAGAYTAPLFVALLSALLLGEPVRPMARLAILVGFGGVMLILKPGGDAFSWQMLLPIGAGLAYAFSGLVTRGKCRDIPAPTLALSLSFALAATGIVGSLILPLLALDPAQIASAPFLLSAWTSPAPHDWIVSAILAALMVANGLVLPRAYQAAPTSIIVTFDYCYLIFATLIGVLFFHERPDLWSILGILLIAGAGLLVTRAQIRAGQGDQ